MSALDVALAAARDEADRRKVVGDSTEPALRDAIGQTQLLDGALRAWVESVVASAEAGELVGTFVNGLNAFALIRTGKALLNAGASQ